jgi:hypothetical protein
MQFGLFYEWPDPTLRQWKTLFEEGGRVVGFGAMAIARIFRARSAAPAQFEREVIARWAEDEPEMSAMAGQFPSCRGEDGHQ